ncbi:MAG: sodium:proton antiporter [Flavobacteriaceae bacterium]|nr:sodium:proton antiporter [Flavobacteriaceae bacterium]
MFQIFTGIVALAAILSFINKKFLKLPETIGVMVLAILTIFLLAGILLIDKSSFLNICQIVEQINFRELLFDFLLSFLLFAGSIHVNLHSLLKEKETVITYASFGVILSTFIIGSGFYFIANAIGLEVNYLYSLIFGALISPTDPVAVLALLKKANAPEKMEIKIVGESLFNDGVGIVVFLSLLSIATMSTDGVEFTHIAQEFIREAGGGLLMGVILGFIGSKLIKAMSHEPIIAVHISLAIVMGGYSLSAMLHISGALAMVVAGLIIGNGLHKNTLSEATKNHINVFWKVLDEIFNAVLFVLIGIEILALDFQMDYLIIGAASIIIVLLSRYISIFSSNFFLKKEQRPKGNELFILTWAGLRGGISIALALTLPESETRSLLLFATYVVVVFSIIAQGLSIEKIITKLLKNKHG